MSRQLKLKSIRIQQLMEIDQEQERIMNLKILNDPICLQKELSYAEINRPGLTLSGFFEHFAFERLQVFGNGEMAYIRKIIREKNQQNLERFFEYEIPACVVTGAQEVPEDVITLADKKHIPILSTSLPTEQFVGLITTLLSDLFAPYQIFHGNFVSIFSIGVLIIGKSGIGKSETVLGLIERNHKFICDDMVKIKKIKSPRGFELVGKPYVDHGPFIEIRGIGIINIAQYYGEGRVIDNQKLQLVIKLQEWRSDYQYDRLGLDEQYMNIMGIKIPVKEIPVSGGRNVPMLVEIAAYREIMRKMGYNSAEELDKKILNFMKSDKEVV